MVQSLMSEFQHALTQVDIGVITAFRGQVLKIRSALRSVDLGYVNVGSVEDLQVNSSMISTPVETNAIVLMNVINVLLLGPRIQSHGDQYSADKQ